MLENTNTISTGLWLYHLQLLLIFSGFSIIPVYRSGFWQCLVLIWYPQLLAVWGKLRGAQWQRLSLSSTSSAEMEGAWCSDPGVHWAVAEWQESCHSAGIRQAHAGFPHQEWLLRNGLKATFFFPASLGMKYHRAISFPCWMRLTQ